MARSAGAFLFARGDEADRSWQLGTYLRPGWDDPVCRDRGVAEVIRAATGLPDVEVVVEDVQTCGGGLPQGPRAAPPPDQIDSTTLVLGFHYPSNVTATPLQRPRRSAAGCLRSVNGSGLSLLSGRLSNMRSSTVREDVAGDDVTAVLLGVLDQLSAHAADPGSASDAARIDRIAVMERLRSTLAAAQCAEMVAFGRGQVEQQLAQIESGRLDPVALGRGISDQIALACRVSPFHGSRRLGVARALGSDLPAVGGLLAAGRISERVAEIVVSQTAHLAPEQRRRVDGQIARRRGRPHPGSGHDRHLDRTRHGAGHCGGRERRGGHRHAPGGPARP
jgi:hypothetical protein